jgi:alkylated DNA nucleotide flippase Atl1
VDDDYLEAVLDLVATIPAGRVMTYGAIAEVLRDRLGRGGPRLVGPGWSTRPGSRRPPTGPRRSPGSARRGAR